MHPVVISIGGNNYPVVAKPFQAVLDIECSLQEIELLVLVDNLLRLSVAVQRLTTKAEDRLVMWVTASRD